MTVAPAGSSASGPIRAAEGRWRRPTRERHVRGASSPGAAGPEAAGPGAIGLDADEARRLLAAIGSPDAYEHPRTGVDLTAAYTELRARAGPPPPLDPRVAHAVHLCTWTAPDMPITSIADEVGLSAPRLRALVRQEVGIALARLRRWGRLRTAIAGLPGATAALAAATAGFADQAHLTRTARDFIGRTPASLRRAGP